MDEKQFKAVNTRTNLRRFIDYIQNGQIEKVTKMCNKGLDPNFHCVDTGGKAYIFTRSYSIIVKMKCFNCSA